MLLCFATLFLGTPRLTWAAAATISATVDSEAAQLSSAYVLEPGKELMLTAALDGSHPSADADWSVSVTPAGGAAAALATPTTSAASNDYFDTYALSEEKNTVLTLKRTSSTLKAPATVTVSCTLDASSATCSFVLAGRGFLWASSSAPQLNDTTQLATPSGGEPGSVSLQKDGSGVLHVGLSTNANSYTSASVAELPIAAALYTTKGGTTPADGTAMVSGDTVILSGVTSECYLALTSTSSVWVCDSMWVKLTPAATAGTLSIAGATAPGVPFADGSTLAAGESLTLTASGATDPGAAAYTWSLDVTPVVNGGSDSASDYVTFSESGANDSVLTLSKKSSVPGPATIAVTVKSGSDTAATFRVHVAATGYLWVDDEVLKSSSSDPLAVSGKSAGAASVDSSGDGSLYVGLSSSLDNYVTQTVSEDDLTAELFTTAEETAQATGTAKVQGEILSLSDVESDCYLKLSSTSTDWICEPVWVKLSVRAGGGSPGSSAGSGEGSSSSTGSGEAGGSTSSSTGSGAGSSSSTSGSAASSEPVATASVDIGGITQHFRLFDPFGAVPAGATLSVQNVAEHGNLDVISDAEHIVSYNISLLDSSGTPVPMPLAHPVRLWFEVLDWMDPEDIEIILAQDGEDTQFEEHLEYIDGKYWVWIETDHFSPYTLVDKLSDKEKAALSNNVKTGDLVAELRVAGFGIVLVYALGIMISLIKNKKRISN